MISIKHNIILYIQFSFYPYDTLWKAPVENPEEWGKSWIMGLFVSIVQGSKPDAVFPWTIFDTLSPMAPEHLAQMSSNVFISWYCQYFFLKHVHLKVGGKHRIWCNNKVKEVCVHPCRKDTSLHPGVDGRDIIVYSCSVTMTATHNPWLLSTWNVWLVSESWDVV